jgi:hypothetical protein
VIVTPLTPFVDNPTGRLTELVYLLSGRPLSLVYEAVLDARSRTASHDPWELVANALHQLQSMTEASIEQRHPQRIGDAAVPAATSATSAKQEKLVVL